MELDRPPPRNRLARQEQARAAGGAIPLPVALLIGGDRGQARQLPGNGWIQAGELGKTSMTDAIARMRQVAVARIFAPRLLQPAEPGLNLFMRGFEKGAQMRSRIPFENRVNAAEPFGPGPAKKLLENGFRLVVKGMRRGYGLGMTGSEEFTEKAITKAAGRFFQAFLPGQRGSGSVPMVEMKREAVSGSQAGDEGGVGIRLNPANAVVHMDNGKNEAELDRSSSSRRKRATESAPPDTATANRWPGWKSRVLELWRRSGHWRGSEKAVAGGWSGYTG